MDAEIKGLNLAATGTAKSSVRNKVFKLQYLFFQIDKNERQTGANVIKLFTAVIY